jgi:hypothetical protein
MWDIRRNLRPGPLPQRRCTIKFTYPELAPDQRSWWLVVESTTVDLCLSDPGYEVDVYVRAALRTMTSIWMGLSNLTSEIEAGHIEIDGDKAISRSIQAWLGLSTFAKGERRAG